MHVVCSGLVVSILDCQSRGLEFKLRPGQKFDYVFLLHLRPLVNSAMMNTLTVHCQKEDETVRERTDHLTSCFEANKMKLLTLHSHECSTESLRNRSSLYGPLKAATLYVPMDC